MSKCFVAFMPKRSLATSMSGLVDEIVVCNLMSFRVEHDFGFRGLLSRSHGPKVAGIEVIDHCIDGVGLFIFQSHTILLRPLHLVSWPPDCWLRRTDV